MSGMPPDSFAPAPSTPIPWEQPGTPLLKGLFETIGLFLSKPREAYRRMPTTPDLVRPLLYYVLLGWLGVAVDQIYSLARHALFPDPGPLERWLAQMGLEKLAGGGGILGVVTWIVIAPIVLVIGIFIGSAIIHLFLWMLGGANGGFLTTVRVVCYAGSTRVLALVPICGSPIGAVWAIVLEILGLAEAHKTTTGKAALAVLLPLLLCCACIAVVAFVAGAAILNLVRGMNH